MNLATQLTLLRILLTFVIMGLLYVPGLFAKSLALALFLVAAATDWLDGYVARRLQHVSPFGILLDPIADKVLVIGLLAAFVQLGLIRAWMLLVIVLRELLITGVRLYAASREVVIPAATEGKHKTVSQMVAITLVLLLLLLHAALPAPRAAVFAAPMHALILACMWITVGLTVISGASFFWSNRTVLADAATRQSDRHRR
ncbi:MAG: CDP-diacylglycerol--glycerol-3-phosphate 3-phosphatidyltransferase [Candidatus Omnitrophica bacterium]|nr:CDP-diacylglycerol--glycerol-3-phosphate 3-phosphatidyltransferase [Candidatus Omnitrophota bacterium]